MENRCLVQQQKQTHIPRRLNPEKLDIPRVNMTVVNVCLSNRRSGVKSWRECKLRKKGKVWKKKGGKNREAAKMRQGMKRRRSGMRVGVMGGTLKDSNRGRAERERERRGNRKGWSIDWLR